MSAPQTSRGDRTYLAAVYLLLAAVLLVAFGSGVTYAYDHRTWTYGGPLTLPLSRGAFDQNDSDLSGQDAARLCTAAGIAMEYDPSIEADLRPPAGTGQVRAATGTVDDTVYVACYGIGSDDDSVGDLAVVDTDGRAAPRAVLKAGGVWPDVGVLTGRQGMSWAALVLVGVLVVPLLWYGGERAPVRRRRSRIGYHVAFAALAVFPVYLLFAGAFDDQVSGSVTGVLLLGFALGWGGSLTLLRRPGDPADPRRDVPAS